MREWNIGGKKNERMEYWTKIVVNGKLRFTTELIFYCLTIF